MKGKKIGVIAIIILIVCVVAWGIFKAKYSPDYLYNQDGTISDGHQDLIQHLKDIENDEERKNQIDFSLEQNLISQEEANDLY